MNKIIYIFFIFFALEIKATENLSVEQKNIKDILLDISEKIENLEKTFLLPDNGFIEDGDASIALVELDKLRVKLKNLEGEIEKSVAFTTFRTIFLVFNFPIISFLKFKYR